MTIKLKDINGIIAKMKSMEYPSDAYSELWFLVGEQFKPLFHRLTKLTYSEENRAEEMQELFLLLPSVIEAYDSTKGAEFFTFLVQRARGFLQKFREQNKLVPDMSIAQKWFRKKRGQESKPEVQVIHAEAVGYFKQENYDDAFSYGRKEHKSGNPNPLKGLKFIEADQDYQLLYDDLIKYIKTFKEADIFLDYYVNEKTAEEICKFFHIQPRVFSFKILQMKKKLAAHLEAINIPVKRVKNKKKSEWRAELGEKNIKKIKKMFESNKYTIKELSRQFKVPRHVLNSIKDNK